MLPLGVWGMRVFKSETVAIGTSEDAVLVRSRVRSWMREMGFKPLDETRMVTAASELARNVLDHGKGGTVRLEGVTDGLRRGLRLIFEDQGPGIPNVDEAMRDGYTTGGGLGLGLGGAKRLAGEFRLVSTPGKGTCVTITRWQ